MKFSKEIKILNLKNTCTWSVSRKIARATELEYLLIQEPSLQYIPAEIGVLQKLRVLLIDSLWLERLPNEIGYLDNLEEIYINCPRLIAIPSFFARMKSLRLLRANISNDTEIPDSIISSSSPSGDFGDILSSAPPLRFIASFEDK